MAKQNVSNARDVREASGGHTGIDTELAVSSSPAVQPYGTANGLHQEHVAHLAPADDMAKRGSAKAAGQIASTAAAPTQGDSYTARSTEAIGENSQSDTRTTAPAAVDQVNPELADARPVGQAARPTVHGAGPSRQPAESLGESFSSPVRAQDTPSSAPGYRVLPSAREECPQDRAQLLNHNQALYSQNVQLREENNRLWRHQLVLSERLHPSIVDPATGRPPLPTISPPGPAELSPQQRNYVIRQLMDRKVEIERDPKRLKSGQAMSREAAEPAAECSFTQDNIAPGVTADHGPALESKSLRELYTVMLAASDAERQRHASEYQGIIERCNGLFYNCQELQTILAGRDAEIVMLRKALERVSSLASLLRALKAIQATVCGADEHRMGVP